MLSKTGAFETELESDPRGPRIRDVMMDNLKKRQDSDDSDDDW